MNSGRSLDENGIESSLTVAMKIALHCTCATSQAGDGSRKVYCIGPINYGKKLRFLPRKLTWHNCGISIVRIGCVNNAGSLLGEERSSRNLYVL